MMIPELKAWIPRDFSFRNMIGEKKVFPVPIWGFGYDIMDCFAACLSVIIKLRLIVREKHDTKSRTK